MPKIPNDAIIITEGEFVEAVKKANEQFMEIGKGKSKGIPGGELMDSLMGLQNILFGELLGAVLFNKNID